MSILCRVDDKMVPLYRVMWLAATPHFCGEDDCTREGCYEIRLEQANRENRFGQKRANAIKCKNSSNSGKAASVAPKAKTTAKATELGRKIAVSYQPSLFLGTKIMAKATDELHWRETYFILFPQSRRPELDKVAQALSKANARYTLGNLSADDGGLIQSILVESSEDHAAVEISYEVGEGVIEQNLEWATQLQGELPDEQLQAHLQKLMESDARLDVAHFERVPAGSSGQPSETSTYDDEFGSEEENFEMLDPTCLLTVVDALSQLTDGLTFDPASGEILT